MQKCMNCSVLIYYIFRAIPVRLQWFWSRFLLFSSIFSNDFSTRSSRVRSQIPFEIQKFPTKKTLLRNFFLVKKKFLTPSLFFEFLVVWGNPRFISSSVDRNFSRVPATNFTPSRHTYPKEPEGSWRKVFTGHLEVEGGRRNPKEPEGKCLRVT